MQGSQKQLPARKLVVYIPTLASGGAERLHINLAPELVARGLDVTILVNQVTGAFADSIPAGIKLVSLGRKRTLSAFLPLITFLNKNKPDIVLSNLEHTNVIAVLAVKLSRVPTRVIVTQHNTFSIESSQARNWKYRILPLFYPALLKRSDGIVAVSRGVAKDLVSNAGMSDDRITVIYNPVVSADFDVRMNEKVSHPWLTENSPPVFVAVGRFVPQKNFAMLMTAFAQVLRQKDARLILIGEGPLANDLQALAVSLGIADRVSMPGFQKNPLAFMHKAAALVLSSNYEGFGNVLVEALACGTPVISTDCPYGPSEILDRGRFGKLVPVGSADAMAQAMLAQLGASPSPEPLRLRGREFNVENAAAQYIQLFDRVMAGARSVK